MQGLPRRIMPVLNGCDGHERHACLSAGVLPRGEVLIWEFPAASRPYEMVPVAWKRMRVCVLLPLEAGSVCHTMTSVLMSIQQKRCSPSP